MKVFAEEARLGSAWKSEDEDESSCKRGFISFFQSSRSADHVPRYFSHARLKPKSTSGFSDLYYYSSSTT